jgi:hypothetical protein
MGVRFFAIFQFFFYRFRWWVWAFYSLWDWLSALFHTATLPWLQLSQLTWWYDNGAWDLWQFFVCWSMVPDNRIKASWLQLSQLTWRYENGAWDLWQFFVLVNGSWQQESGISDFYCVFSSQIFSFLLLLLWVFMNFFYFLCSTPGLFHWWNFKNKQAFRVIDTST